MAADDHDQGRIRARAAVQGIVDRYLRLAEKQPGEGPEVRKPLDAFQTLCVMQGPRLTVDASE